MTSRSVSTLPIRLGALLAALALLVRVLVPSGFMPVASTGTMPTLVMCTGQGPMVMAMPAELAGTQKQDQGHDGGMADHACPFGALAGALDISAPIAPIAMPFIAVALATATPLLARPGLGLAAPPPPKTGPPILA